MQNTRLAEILRRHSHLGVLGAALASAALGYGGDAHGSDLPSGPMTLPQLGKRMASPQRFFQCVEPAMELEPVAVERSSADPVSEKSSTPEKSVPATTSSTAKIVEKPSDAQSAGAHNNALLAVRKESRDSAAAEPKLLPDEGNSLQAVPTSPTSSGSPNSRGANAALKAAMINALANHAPKTEETAAANSPVVEKPIASARTVAKQAGASPRNLALRHLSPSRYFQTGEPALEMRALDAHEANLKALHAAELVEQTGGVSPANALRPVPPDAAALEDVPADPTATPPTSQALVLPEKTPAKGTSQETSTNPIPPSPSPAGSPPGSQGGTVAEADKLGSAPESNNLQFLRTEAVLLDPGQWQFDYGLTYSVLDNHFPVALVDGGGDVVGVSDAQARQRQLIVPLAVRYGCSEHVQLFANMPVGWANTEVAYSGIENESNVGGLGDIDAGASLLLKRATEPLTADIVATIAFTAPTGNASFPASILEPSDGMGEGYWALSESVLFIHTIDPVVLFYEIGYRHRFDADFGRTRVNPGEEINYQFGAGFAVNPWITFSGSVIGAHLTSIQVNDTDIDGSGRDPIRLRLSVTAVNGRHIIEPFAEVQMTNDAPSRVGVVFTY